MSEAEIEPLVRRGVVERVRADRDTARAELGTARRHLEAADKIVEDDPVLAFIGLYDAMRKAVSAHMRARGLRVVRGAGAHARTVEYARVALVRAGIAEALDEFDALRTLRNQSEYEAVFIDIDEVAAARTHARALVDAVERAL
jgi:hypothetical protein